MSVLVCPVCQGTMREVSKNGVLIDTCMQCRGVWLDRGELEKLANVVEENRGSWGGGRQSGSFLGGAAPQQRRDYDERRDDRRYPDRDDDDDDRRRRQLGYGAPQKKRKSFLDLFD